MGGKTSTSTQAVSIPPQVLAQYQSVNEGAEAAAQTGFQSYGGIPQGTSQQLVAPVNSEQTSGIEGVNNAAGLAQGQYNNAIQGIQQSQNGVTGTNALATGLAAGASGAVNPTTLDANAINQYMSPYLSDVVGSESNLLNQNNQQQQSGQLGTAINSGAFGGDRTGLAAANLEQQQNLSNANIYANLLNTGFTNAQGVAQQQQGVGLAAGQANRQATLDSANSLSAIGATQYGEGANTATTEAGLGAGQQTAALEGANAQIAAGTVQQQTQQASDTADYNQFLQQQSYPYQQAQFLANIAEGTGSLSGSTTTTQQPGGFFSDRRLKYDLKKIGETYDKQPIYSYKMHGDARTHVGLIAQKVEKKHPEAVGLASGFKTVDYGKATEKAAAKGKFNLGGKVSDMEAHRARKAGGGSLGDVLEAQRQMYGGMGNGQQQRNVATGSGGQHQLTVASGSPPPADNGASKVTQGMNLVNNGNKLYKSFNGKPTGTPNSGLAAGDGGSGGTTGVYSPSSYGYDGATTYAAGPNATASGAAASSTPDATVYGLDTAPAAADGTWVGGAGTGAAAGAGDTAAAGAGSAAAGAAGDAAATGAASSAAGAAAGTAAAGAAEYASADAAAEAAAALAAEYAAAEVGTAAIMVAKRGGAIKDRRHRDLGGGMPYGGDNDIPDDPNTHTMAKPGPLVKSKTGLQTLEYMGQPDNAQSISGDMFSNEALRRGGGVGFRRNRSGFAAGGDPGDDDTPTVIADDTPTAAADDSSSGLAAGASSLWDKIKKGAKAVGDNFKENREAYVPLLEGLGAMGTAKTRDFGTALAAGLGQAGKSYIDEQTPLATSDKLKAETQGVGLENQLKQVKVDWAKDWDKNNVPAAAQPVNDGPLDSRATAEQIDGYYRNKYANIVPYTPQESQMMTAARKASAAMGSDQPIQDAQSRVEQRKANDLYQKQQGAQHEAAGLYATINDPSTTPNERARAQIQYNAVHQHTGEKFEEMGGNMRGSQTGLPQPGSLAAVMSPGDRAHAIAQANELVDVRLDDGSIMQVPGYINARDGSRSGEEYVDRNGTRPPPGTSGWRAMNRQPTGAPPARTGAAPAPAPAGSGVMGGPAAPPVNPARPAGAAPAPVAARPVAAPPAAASGFVPTNQQAANAEKAGDHKYAVALSDTSFDLPKSSVQDRRSQSPNDLLKANKLVENQQALQKVASQQASAAGQSRQFLMAAKEIMESKGAPLVGAYGGVNQWVGKKFGTVTSSNYEEVVKNLVNAATASAQATYGSEMTQKEWGTHLEEATPNTFQNRDSLMDLIKGNLKSANYTLDLANKSSDYLASGKDPLNYEKWVSKYYPRAENVNLQHQAPPVGTVRNGHAFRGGNPADPANWPLVQQKAVGQ